MKRFLLVISFCCFAQQIIQVPSDPSGSCTGFPPLQLNVNNGHMSACIKGQYTLIIGASTGLSCPSGNCSIGTSPTNAQIVTNPASGKPSGFIYGETEPTLPYGSSNSFSSVKDGYITSNHVTGGSHPTYLNYYVSNGTPAVPTAISNGTIPLTELFWGYVGSAYTNFGGRAVNYFSDRASFTYTDNIINTTLGITANASSEWEFNNGNPSSDGGSLVKIDVAGIKVTALPTSCTGLATGTIYNTTTPAADTVGTLLGVCP